MADLSRRDFLAVAAVLGIGATVPACSDDTDDADPADGTGDGPGPTPEPEPTPSTGDGANRAAVLVIGAGAAGMAAGHLLAQRGVDFRILEAAPTHGGRIKRTKDFVDFPIPLGGEWLHASESTLREIVNDETVEITQEMRGYAAEDEVALVVDGQAAATTLGGGYTDLKFVGATWLDFFEAYVLPGIADRMVFDTPITAIDHSGDGVTLTDAGGDTWDADHVIVTVPMKILQDGDITFTPPLPETHRSALDEANIWTGMKVFLEFDEPFYPVFLEFAEDRGLDGQRAYYDAAYGQDTDRHVLGLFLVGEPAGKYQAADPGDELRDLVLAELDALFDGAATRSYVQHVAQNWAEEPYIRAAYLEDFAPSWISSFLAEPLGDLVHFAGCSYTRFDDWSSVHTAARSARDAVNAIAR